MKAWLFLLPSHTLFVLVVLLARAQRSPGVTSVAKQRTRTGTRTRTGRSQQVPRRAHTGMAGPVKQVLERCGVWSSVPFSVPGHNICTSSCLCTFSAKEQHLPLPRAASCAQLTRLHPLTSPPKSPDTQVSMMEFSPPIQSLLTPRLHLPLPQTTPLSSCIGLDSSEIPQEALRLELSEQAHRKAQGLPWRLFLVL